MKKFLLTAAPACATLLSFIRLFSPARQGCTADTDVPETVVVTASPFAQDPHRSLRERGADPARGAVPTGGFGLGDALRNVPGVTSSGLSPGAARPVIRGFDASRVRVTENGIGSHDVSDISADHGVPIDPLVFGRGRGAARTGHAPLWQPGDRRRGQRHQQPHSAGHRRGRDLRRPSPALPATAPSASPARSPTSERQVGLPRRRHHSRRRRLRHALGDTRQHLRVRARLCGRRCLYRRWQERRRAWLQSVSSRITASRRSRADEVSHIDLDQSRYSGALRFSDADSRHQRHPARGSYSDYTHDEIVAGEGVLATFNNQEWEGRVEALHAGSARSAPAPSGVQWNSRDFEALGEGADYLLPTETGASAPIFSKRFALSRSFNLEAAARIESASVGRDRGAGPFDRDFTPRELLGRRDCSRRDGRALRRPEPVAHRARART